MQQTLSSAFGHYSLARFPPEKNQTLRAWDAADELVLNHIHQHSLATSNSRILIVNDQFGALSISLHQFQPEMISDSFIAQQATLHNNSLNKQKATELISSVSNLTGRYDLVVIKVQKSLAQLEELLYKIRPHLTADTVVLGYAMTKMIHTSTLALFSKLIGNTHTSLATKKARLIFSHYDPLLSPRENPYPECYLFEDSQIKITNHANVFSRAKLDIGSRFFIEHLPRTNNYETIVDLGCGNGVIGLMAAINNPSAKLAFYDESHMAICSAQQNFTDHFDDTRYATYQVNDCLEGVENNSVDLVLNNPPFHQQNTMGDFIARKMFRQSLQALKTGGELWVIGNKHLGYQSMMKKLFGNVRQISTNKKFVILCALKQ